jgi:hypothetical protein
MSVRRRVTPADLFFVLGTNVRYEFFVRKLDDAIADQCFDAYCHGALVYSSRIGSSDGAL